MSTIEQLVATKLLLPYEVPEWERRNAIRPFLYSPAIMEWFGESSERHDGSLTMGNRTPWDHFETFANDVRCATRPRVGDMKRLEPTKDGLWKAHPPMLRVFGWCYAKDSFVAISIALERDIKNKQNPVTYALEKQKVKDFIKFHGLQQAVLRGDHLAVFTS